MKKYLFILLVVSTAFFACSGGGNTSTAPAAAGTGELEGFSLISNPNSNSKTAIKKDANGDIIAQGELLNGKKVGTWLTFHDGRKAGVIKTATSFVDNEIQGTHLEFDNIGRVQLKSFYTKGMLHGAYVKYEYGKPKEEAHYNIGQLDGMYRSYYQNGKKQQETEYKNGKKDGRSVFYNEDEEVIMDYQYKNGEQVSGGQVQASSTAKE